MRLMFCSSRRGTRVFECRMGGVRWVNPVGQEVVYMLYEIKVLGQIDPSWSSWYNRLQITCDAGRDGRLFTILTGMVPDQAALRGILNHLWDLNHTLLSVLLIEQQTFPPKEKGSSDGS